MEKRILIDLNDKANWLYESTSPPTPGGTIVEENRVILMPEGEHRLFAFTDAVMHYAEDAYQMSHDHRSGFETFFVDSGSMEFYSQGKVATLKKGDLIHIQPFVTHGMVFNEDTRYRGIFQDWAVIDDFPETYRAKAFDPDASAKIAASGAPASYDFNIHDAKNYVRAEASEIPAVRNPERPLAQYKFDGVTLNQVVGRWETYGVREIWQAKLEKGFSAQWVDFPLLPELFYVTSGKVKFTVYGEEYTAFEDCLVKIPKFAPHSIIAETDAAMYDLGGLSMWELFLADYTAGTHTPEDVKSLKDKYKIQIKSFGGLQK
ncbi:MAG: cupin domain-containing protein [Oscillospiraceae bacterium]|jgi:quercetin dioxygenase-like cupin family protein|nr:cupin domain-containing protein [Oscillospiraceae bacterium]